MAIISPAPNSPVTGTVNVRADAADNAGVTRVEFFVDDRLLGADHSAPYEFAIDTRFDTNIWHRVTAREFDAAGNSGEASINLRTENGGVRPNIVGTLGGWNFDPASSRHPRARPCNVRMITRSASPNRMAVDFTPIFRSSSRSVMA